MQSEKKHGPDPAEITTRFTYQLTDQFQGRCLSTRRRGHTKKKKACLPVKRCERTYGSRRRPCLASSCLCLYTRTTDTDTDTATLADDSPFRPSCRHNTCAVGLAGGHELISRREKQPGLSVDYQRLEFGGQTRGRVERMVAMPCVHVFKPAMQATCGGVGTGGGGSDRQARVSFHPAVLSTLGQLNSRHRPLSCGSLNAVICSCIHTHSADFRPGHLLPVVRTGECENPPVDEEEERGGSCARRGSDQPRRGQTKEEDCCVS